MELIKRLFTHLHVWYLFKRHPSGRDEVDGAFSTRNKSLKLLSKINIKFMWCRYSKQQQQQRQSRERAKANKQSKGLIWCWQGWINFNYTWKRIDFMVMRPHKRRILKFINELCHRDEPVAVSGELWKGWTQVCLLRLKTTLQQQMLQHNHIR